MKKFLGEPGGKAFAAAGVLFLVLALVALWPVATREGYSCGSWIGPDDSIAAIFDKADDCEQRRGSKTPLVAILGGLTVAGVVVGFVQRGRPAAATAPPTSV